MVLAPLLYREQQDITEDRWEGKRRKREREEEKGKGMMRSGSLIRLSREVRNDFFTIRLIPVSVTLPLSVVSL